MLMNRATMSQILITVLAQEMDEWGRISADEALPKIQRLRQSKFYEVDNSVKSLKDAAQLANDFAVEMKIISRALAEEVRRIQASEYERNQTKLQFDDRDGTDGDIPEDGVRQ